MKDANINWTYPDTRKSGGPLPIEEIQHIELNLRVVGAPDFDPIAEVTPPTTTRTIPELSFGNWELQTVIVDQQNRRSSGKITPFFIPDDSAPEDAVNVTVELV